MKIANTVDEIDNPIAKNKLKEILKNNYVLGLMVWGSRATGFGENISDWDVLIYVTDNFLQSLKTPSDIAIYDFDESVEPKRLVVDFTYLSDSVFEDQLNSPLDIDHLAYAEGNVIHDPTGKLEEWRQKLSEFPNGEEYIDRLKMKWIQITISHYYAIVDNKRGFKPDSQLNLMRTLIGAVNFWFSLKKSWTPPLKYFSKYLQKLGIDDETFNLFINATEDLSLENIGLLIKKLHALGEDQGIDFSTFHNDFLSTILPSGRPKLIKHSYM